jgi:hypothetical protein
MTDKKTEPALSKLDWFAGQALCGLLSDPDTIGMPEDYASLAFRYAEAMMVESELDEAARNWRKPNGDLPTV